MTSTKFALYTIPILAALMIGTSFSTTFALVPPGTFEVQIDIKPGSDPNSVNPRSNGVIPVAILGTDDFDPTQVDTETLIFTAFGDFYFDATAVHIGFEDVNGDGVVDLVAHFLIQSTGIDCHTTEAEIIGSTLDGTLFFGRDSVNPVGNCPRNNTG